MAQYLEIEELDKLIKGVLDYQKELDDNATILRNAGNVCDDAMGNDDLVKKQIIKLENALNELKKVSQYASDMAEALKREKLEALDIYHNS